MAIRSLKNKPLIQSVHMTHVVADCTGSRRLFYSKSHLSPVPSLLLSKMQTFHWFAFWFFFQCLKTVGHPAFLFILRKAGCPFLMSRKQLFRQSNNQTVAEIFERFVASQTAKGVSDKTIQNYYSHLHSLQKHLDFSAPLATLTKEDLDNMVISMRQSGLAHNSISSYLRVFRTFLNWARKAGYTELEMANYKDKETVKETYTDAELMLLLQKPARSCDFCEYRNWVIINFLVNCGCRAGTIRNIASIFYCAISNAMTLYRIDSYIINIVTGIILLLAFSLNPIMQIVNERKNKADARKPRNGGKA